MKRKIKYIILVITIILFVCICIFLKKVSDKDDFNVKETNIEHSNETLIHEVNILLPNYSLKDLVENSEYIIVGKCIGKNDSQYSKTINPITEEVYNTISTDFKIEVSETLKGNLESENIVIRSDIGKIDNFECQCDEQVYFSDNEEVLLFINKDKFNNENCYRASFYIASKYTLVNNEYYNSYFDSTIQLSEINHLLMN